MSEIRHIFFDLDNTLWDFRKNSKQALLELFKKKNIESIYNVTFEQFYNAYDPINEQLWADLRDLIISKEELRNRRFLNSFKAIGIDNTELSEYFETNYLNQVTNYNHLVDGTSEILKYLSKNYSLHILTNGFQEVTHRKINLSELKNKFATITSADELDLRKPNPKIFTHALQKANATVQESAFIGDDWIADAIGAHQMKMKSIFFNALNEDFSHPHIQNIDSLLELKEIF